MISLALLRPVIHVVLHFAVPGLVAWVGYRTRWFKVWLILSATILVDLDHLLATPLFDPNRCSIGYHPMHSEVAIVVYGVLLLVPKLRLVAMGLLIHMALDGIDCAWMRLI